MDGKSRSQAASAVFYRDLARPLPMISHGEGVYLFDTEGRRYLDAVGGAAVVAIGHGVREITDAIAEQGPALTYSYGATFTHRWQEELARRLLSIAPANMARVYFVSGGSEANETAIKMAREYFVHQGKLAKHKIISRWHSFHGVTLGTLSVSGRPTWRAPYDPYMRGSPQLPPPYCYRCPFQLTYPGCGVACADELEKIILREGPETVAALLIEPISGTALTGTTPVLEYHARLREICDRHDVLIIADEVLCGFGRTGKPFAVDHWDFEPDILTCGKAAGSGYAPIAAAIASRRVVDAFAAGGGQFTHGFTYSGHPLSCFVGVQVFDYMERHGLFARSAEMGAYLQSKLAALAQRHAIIGEVRGRGMLAGIELVRDRDTRTPLPAAARVTERIVKGAFARGLMLIGGTPNPNYGRGGDHLQITPPYVITREEIDQLVDGLDAVLGEVTEQGLEG